MPDRRFFGMPWGDSRNVATLITIRLPSGRDLCDANHMGRWTLGRSAHGTQAKAWRNVAFLVNPANARSRCVGHFRPTQTFDDQPIGGRHEPVVFAMRASFNRCYPSLHTLIRGSFIPGAQVESRRRSSDAVHVEYSAMRVGMEFAARRARSACVESTVRSDDGKLMSSEFNAEGSAFHAQRSVHTTAARAAYRWLRRPQPSHLRNPGAPSRGYDRADSAVHGSRQLCRLNHFDVCVFGCRMPTPSLASHE